MNRRRLIILGAGRPRDQGRQSSLRQITSEHGSVLEWQLHAFENLVDDVEFIGGYEIDRIIRRFPDLTYHYNNGWAETGAIHSLSQALDLVPFVQDLYVIYADILLRRRLTEGLADPDGSSVSVALEVGSPDALRPLRDGRLPESLRLADGTGEFVGAVHVPAKCFEAFRAFVQDGCRESAKLGLSALVEAWAKKGHEVRIASANGDWAHLEDDRSIAKFVLGTKAATLSQLGDGLTRSRILPLFSFSRMQWQENPERLMQSARSLLRAERLAVRSSAADEDGFATSKAGAYRSHLDVSPKSKPFGQAVDDVFKSYHKHDASDEVLVQPMLARVRASGVAVTRSLASGAPYYVLNYVEDGDTLSVTGGTSRAAVVWNIARCRVSQTVQRLPVLPRTVLEAVREIEEKVCYDRLDIEFATDDVGDVIVFQVRPLVLRDETQDLRVDSAIERTLASIHDRIGALDRPAEGQVGERTCWSVMADWNPAEIIGRKPWPLSFDLYRYVITDGVWSQQRRQSGYRHVRDWPLIRKFGGQAFVDVRASLNSFVPAALPDSTAARIVDWGSSRLRRSPELHDKIEFEVVPTCLDFRFATWEQRSQADGVLDVDEVGAWRDALRDITLRTVRNVEDHLGRAQDMERRFGSVDEPFQPRPDCIRSLLNSTRDEAALTFAHLARAGFVAMALLKSAVSRGFLDSERYDELLRSVRTVSSLVSDAAWQVKTGKLDRREFILRFGHLRPGTYDVSNPSYRMQPERYLDPIIEKAGPSDAATFVWTKREAGAITQGLQELNMPIAADDLLAFVHKAVSGREYGKFVFTRPLSRAIDLMIEEASALGLDPDMIDFMPLNFFFEAAVDIGDDAARAQALIRLCDERRRDYRVAAQIELPETILEAGDIYAYRQPDVTPNFITSGACSGELVMLSAADIAPESVSGKLVAIENADPGYDYLFSLGIKGLITAYGGPNSHMAIRAAEFGLPAVIGIGHAAFAALRPGMIIDLDCRMRVFRQMTVS